MVCGNGRQTKTKRNSRQTSADSLWCVEVVWVGIRWRWFASGGMQWKHMAGTGVFALGAVHFLQLQHTNVDNQTPRGFEILKCTYFGLWNTFQDEWRQTFRFNFCGIFNWKKDNKNYLSGKLVVDGNGWWTISQNSRGQNSSEVTSGIPGMLNHNKRLSEFHDHIRKNPLGFCSTFFPPALIPQANIHPTLLLGLSFLSFFLVVLVLVELLHWRFPRKQVCFRGEYPSTAESARIRICSG